MDPWIGFITAEVLRVFAEFNTAAELRTYSLGCPFWVKNQEQISHRRCAEIAIATARVLGRRRRVVEQGHWAGQIGRAHV